MKIFITQSFPFSVTYNPLPLTQYDINLSVDNLIYLEVPDLRIGDRTSKNKDKHPDCASLSLHQIKSCCISRLIDLFDREVSISLAWASTNNRDGERRRLDVGQMWRKRRTFWWASFTLCKSRYAVDRNWHHTGAVSGCLDTHLQWQQSNCVTSRINLIY